jgi:formate dehydrogenase iron-sulfur subunit
MTAVTVYVPCDAAALSIGAEAVATAIAAECAARGIELKLIRNGSRGACWLETLVEVATPKGRVAYGPVTGADVPGLFAADFLNGKGHQLFLGPTDEIAWFASQQRLTFARVGVVDPGSVADYVANGGYQGLRRALSMPPQAIVQAVLDSGLRGRGGAAFPTGIKWKTVLEQVVEQKYVTCNADEGDSGTFSDRMLMEGDPLCLIEGMTIAGIAVGATQGYIYLRAEYPHSYRALNTAIAAAYQARYLGSDVSIWRCGSEPAPTCAAKRPRCCRVSKASAAKSGCVRRCPPSTDCS